MSLNVLITASLGGFYTPTPGARERGLHARLQPIEGALPGTAAYQAGLVYEDPGRTLAASATENLDWRVR